MRAVFLVLLGLALALAAPESSQRIVGGSTTTITQYPFSAALLYSLTGSPFSFTQTCGGTILNNRSILTSAYCLRLSRPLNWHVRLGSTYANSGGFVHTTTALIVHPNYNSLTDDSDVAILRVTTAIGFNNNVRAGQIAGANYNLADNQPVWAIGWGSTASGGPRSVQLRHVQIWTVNQAICRQRFAEVGNTVTDNMLCAGWLDVGGRDQCGGDEGSPLLHNNVAVGVSSWGRGCGQARHPGVNTRVSSFTSWIQANA